MERQQCESCRHYDKTVSEEPCKSCDWNVDTFTFSNFTTKKDINQVLREKLGYVEPPKVDMVKQPNHYILKPGLEVRDVLECLVDKMNQQCYDADWPLQYVDSPLFKSDYVQMMQYLMRFMDKNGKQDLEKAKWYLDKLIEAYE